jgi:hypothetical protein
VNDYAPTPTHHTRPDLRRNPRRRSDSGRVGVRIIGGTNLHMKPELVAALSALTTLDAARIHANAIDEDIRAHGGNGLFRNPNELTAYESELRVWADEQLSHEASARNEENARKTG